MTLPFAGALAFWQAYDGIIPLILRDTFHFGDTLAGRVMVLDNVCALFLLPLFGSLSDHCHNCLGRRTPLYYHWLPAGSFTDPVSGCCLSCWSVFPLRYLMWSIPVICRYFLLFQGSSFFVRFCLQYFFGKGRQWKGCMKKALPWESRRRKLSFPRRVDRKRNLIRRFGDLCLRFCFVYFLLYGIQCSNLCIQQICQPGVGSRRWKLR